MHHRHWSISCFVCATLLASAGVAAGEIDIVVNPRSVSLPATGSIVRVTIGDVAQVSGGTTPNRNRISALDLDTLLNVNDSCHVSRQQIASRLLIAGFHRDEFRVSGTQTINVRLALGDWLREALEPLLAIEISRQFGLEPAAVLVRLVDDDQISDIESRLSGERLAPTVLLSPQLPIGSSAIDIELEDKQGRRFMTKLDVQVIVAVEVTLATHRIKRGTVIDRGMIQTIQRPMLQTSDFVSFGEAIGAVASKDIARHEVILAKNVTEPTENREPIVRRNDLIDVMVKLGRSEIRLKNAKAMSSGRVGDTITALNTQSNQQLSVTVVDRNLAIVAAPGNQQAGVRR